MQHLLLIKLSHSGAVNIGPWHFKLILIGMRHGVFSCVAAFHGIYVAKGEIVGTGDGGPHVRTDLRTDVRSNIGKY